MKTRLLIGALTMALLAVTSCKKDGAEPAPGEGTPAEAARAEKKEKKKAAPVRTTEGLQSDVGVDPEKKRIRIGALDDQSGPGASLSLPYARGKRVLAAQVNAGGSGLLPDGWTIELVERDHGYDPEKALAAYEDTVDDVLFYGSVFGTPIALALQPRLAEDGVLAFPASFSSEIARHRNTIPIGPSYRIEAMRALDWAVDNADDVEAVVACVVYQEDHYGEDGRDGWQTQAKKYGVPVARAVGVEPGQTNVTPVVTALRDAACTHVMLVVLPKTTAPLLATAKQLDFTPIWIGSTAAWSDRFFDADLVPRSLFTSFFWVMGFPYWGEDVPGMDAFLAAWKAHAAEGAEPNAVTLLSYAEGLAQLEAARRAIEAGDITREGFAKQLRSLSDFDAGGLVQPLDFTRFPYATSRRTRVLKPDFDARSWQTIADWATPAINP